MEVFMVPALHSLVVWGASAILLIFAIESVHAADKVSAPDQRTNLLAITAYPAGGRCSLHYLVTESGRRNAYSGVIPASHWKQLSDTNLTSLRAAIRELPAESVLPPIERLVIVSFRDGTNWVTRRYDDDALPKPMRQIYAIIGAQSESKNER
jgi:hypothetical protein